MTKELRKQRRAAYAAALRDLEALQREWKESLAHYDLRVTGQFKELRRRLTPKPRGPQPPGLPSAKAVKAIHEELGRARIKPAKGRSKDLRRVDEALDRAIGRLPPR